MTTDNLKNFKVGTRVIYYGDRATVKEILDHGLIVKFDDQDDFEYFATKATEDLKLVNHEESLRAYTAIEHVVREKNLIEMKFAKLVDEITLALNKYAVEASEALEELERELDGKTGNK